MRRIVVTLLVLAVAARAQAEPTRAVRGLASQVEVDYAPPLRARADQSPTSTVMVRITSLVGGSRQRIEYIGTVAGNFDLREYVEREDGRPLSDLAPIAVTIVSQLPPDHGTDLYSSGESWFGWRGHYRELMWGVVALWAAAPIVYLIVRAMRKRAIEAPATVAWQPITVEDQLRAALAGAESRALTVAEQGQLELLVFRYFGERLGTAGGAVGNPVEALRLVRAHPETRELVGAIERWLHAHGDGGSDRDRAASALEELRRSRLSTVCDNKLTPNAKRVNV